MSTTGRRARAAGTLILWLALLCFVLLRLHALGGVLGPPPVTEPAGLSGWLQARQPAEAAFALLRLVALGTAWYLLSATLLSTLAHLSRVPTIVRTSDLLTVPAIRRLAGSAAGMSVAAATLTTGAGMATAATDPPPHAAHESGTLLPESGTSPSVDTPPLPTLRRLPDEPAPVPPPPSAPPAPQAPQPTDRWEIRPGQHFWSVAESVLASSWGREPSDDEVDPYWRQLVGANRSILRDPDIPDLLYPGQVITVPAPPAPPAPPAT